LKSRPIGLLDRRDAPRRDRPYQVAGENAYDLDFKTKGDLKDPKLKLSGDELLALYAQLADKYPIATIEDPFDQDDWANWCGR
jgi:enolase